MKLSLQSNTKRPNRRLCMAGLEFMCWGRLSSGPRHTMHSGANWESTKRYCTVFRKKRITTEK